MSWLTAETKTQWRRGQRWQCLYSRYFGFIFGSWEEVETCRPSLYTAHSSDTHIHVTTDGFFICLLCFRVMEVEWDHHWTPWLVLGCLAWTCEWYPHDVIYIEREGGANRVTNSRLHQISFFSSIYLLRSKWSLRRKTVEFKVLCRNI